MYIDKIIDIQDISNKVVRLRGVFKNTKIVTTNGAFDLLHSGHLHSLYRAKKLGDILIVGLNSDKSIRTYKSKDRPIIPQEERAKMLAALEFVDCVVIFDEPNPIYFLDVVKPNFHVKSRSGYKGLEKDIVEKNGGKIVLIDDVVSLSTSDIIRRVLDKCGD